MTFDKIALISSIYTVHKGTRTQEAHLSNIWENRVCTKMMPDSGSRHSPTEEDLLEKSGRAWADSDP